MRSLKEEIKDKAVSLGFHKVGVAKATKTPEAKKQLNQWIHSGFNATMKWVEKRSTERGDIHKYFPNAKSVISVGLNYYNQEPTWQHPYKISRYAWGDDYHNIVKSKLFQLLEYIQSVKPNTKGVVCSDTSPVMEKVWAQRAGLGWIGKHTNLITKDYGSWLFLGELILDFEIEPDVAFEQDHCGSCSACVDACPTHAIVDRQVDANKCISYLTIEHRGELPKALQNDFQNWIYGCDICQDVCPWNHKSEQQTDLEVFFPREQIVQWTSSNWDQMNEYSFRNVFRGSAVKRTKHSGLTRNINFVSEIEKPKIN